MTHQRDSFPSFLHRDASVVARKLLGCYLVRELRDETVRVRIVETESYDQADAASHSFNGQTARTDVMFGEAGHLYVYFTYGMHYCCNVVTGKLGGGAAVLIRAVEPVKGTEILELSRGKKGVEVTNGPAKLCQALSIDKDLNGHDLRHAGGGADQAALQLVAAGDRADDRAGTRADGRVTTGMLHDLPLGSRIVRARRPRAAARCRAGPTRRCPVDRGRGTRDRCGRGVLERLTIRAQNLLTRRDELLGLVRLRLGCQREIVLQRVVGTRIISTAGPEQGQAGERRDDDALHADAQLAQRFALLEAQVKLLSDQLGMPCPPFASSASSGSAVPAEVVELVRAGKKIQAISELRRMTGASLVEAKDIVEMLGRRIVGVDQQGDIRFMIQSTIAHYDSFCPL